MVISSRRYESRADLRRMQALQQELWEIEGPRTQTHVGDLAWWATMHVGREPEWKRQLWLEGDRGVAWAWLNLPGALDHSVHTSYRGDAVHEQVLDWFEAEAKPGSALHTYAMEGDDASQAILARRGFEEPAAAKSYACYVHDRVPECCEVTAPEGFTLRPVRGRDDLHERVEVHRATWAPSRVTDESDRNVMRTWPYRTELDCVLEASDGTFAAYVLCWYDDANRVGEFEPVGVHPSHRRRGFGALVCRYALSRLREVGASTAVVYAEGGDAGAPARALYESVGFRLHTRIAEVVKR